MEDEEDDDGDEAVNEDCWLGFRNEFGSFVLVSGESDHFDGVGVFGWFSGGDLSFEISE